MSGQRAAGYKPGQVVVAEVDQVFSYGVFAHLDDGTPAYIRRRELTLAGNVEPEQVVIPGQKLRAAVLLHPEPGRRMELSARQAEPDPWEAAGRSLKVRDSVTATVKNYTPQGVWVQITPGVDGFIPAAELAPWPVPGPGDLLWVGDQVEAMISDLDSSARVARLSIRRQMMHQARVHRVTEHIQTEGVPAEAAAEPEESQPPPAAAADLSPLGRVLVIDDDRGVRHGLVSWLQRLGCPADGVSGPSEGFDRATENHYGLVIMDLDLAGQDGLDLLQTLRQVQPDAPVVVISIPEWIAQRSQDLEDAAVAEVFTKPLNLDEVAETLARLAQGEKLGPFRTRSREGGDQEGSPSQRLAQAMRSGLPLDDRLEMVLTQLVRQAGAELGVLFHLDPVSQQVEVTAKAGKLAIQWETIRHLTRSPVKDLILSGREEFETRVSSGARPRFEKLLAAVDFQSCLGVPVWAVGRLEHALFLFHREPEAFSRYRLRDAHAAAALLGVALESRALEERILYVNPFLVSGQLAAGFGHDVFNKMTGLELQVRNLRAACRVQAAKDKPGSPADAPSCRQAAQDLDQLLETTLDLRRTVEAFQELIRAEAQASLDVNYVVTRSALLLRSIAQRSRIRIEMNLCPDLPPVAGSPVRLQQAFLNVMLNAIQHTAHKRERWPQGEGRLQITTGIEEDGTQPVCVRFTDTGPGIHCELWDRIFALGFSTRLGGSGLGLFIARSLVESMAGQITVEHSAIPAGTTFLVRLPAAAAQPEE